MTRNSWKTALKEALEREDPDQKLKGHSIFARVNNESSPSLEIVPDPAKPNELRLLLTHYRPEKPKGDHVVVIGMNPRTHVLFQDGSKPRVGGCRQRTRRHL